MRAVVLHDEAVEALLDATHCKHRRVLAAVELSTGRSSARVGPARIVVPTAVRLSGGGRRRRAAGGLDRLRVRDVVFDRPFAYLAVLMMQIELRVSHADARLAVVLVDSEESVAVLTGDVDTVRRIATHLGVAATIVAL